jgi:hypothetical protein
MRIVVLAVIVAVACVAGALAGCYGMTIHLVDQNNHKFCSYLENVVPRTKKPTDPAANPSRETDYKFSLKTDRFEHAIGCNA